MQVHTYRSNGMNIVLDVPSGSVHVADDLFAEAVRKMQELGDAQKVEESLLAELSAGELSAGEGEDPEEAVREVISEMEELRAEGALFTEEPYRPDVERFAARPTVVKALCLHVAHDCNLACRYCFAEEGEYHGRRALMSYETGKKALDFLVANSGARRNLEVDFFGGEPLMNFEVVKKLVAYGRSLEEASQKTDAPKHFRFTITTNGVLINDDVIDFCNREMHNVVLSIDGRPEVHDRMRPFRGGQGSYERILPKLLKFAKSREEAGLSYYVRGTYTHFNLDFAADVLHLADLGFKEISVEPVVAPPEAPYAIREEDIPVLKEQYEVLAAEMLRRRREGRGFHFFHFMIDLSGGPCIYKRLSGCGSGSEYLAVTPWGDLYPCHQFVGNEDFLLGNVDEGVKRQDLVTSFKKVNVYAKKECSECFARFFCSGGCAANSYQFTGSICDVYPIGCALQQKRIECALALKAAED